MRSILQPGSALRRVVEDKKRDQRRGRERSETLEWHGRDGGRGRSRNRLNRDGLEPHRLSGLLRGLRKKA